MEGDWKRNRFISVKLYREITTKRHGRRPNTCQNKQCSFDVAQHGKSLGMKVYQRKGYFLSMLRKHEFTK